MNAEVIRLQALYRWLSEGHSLGELEEQGDEGV